MVCDTKSRTAGEELASFDEDDLETLKTVREQYLAADLAEIKEVTEHAKKVDIFRFQILVQIIQIISGLFRLPSHSVCQYDSR